MNFPEERGVLEATENLAEEREEGDVEGVLLAEAVGEFCGGGDDGGGTRGGGGEGPVTDGGEPE